MTQDIFAAGLSLFIFTQATSRGDPPFQNIHVYPLIYKILGLEIPEDIDGEMEVLEPVLKRKQ